MVREKCKKVNLVRFWVPGKRFSGSAVEGNFLVQILKLVVQIGTNHGTVNDAGKMWIFEQWHIGESHLAAVHHRRDVYEMCTEPSRRPYSKLRQPTVLPSSLLPSINFLFDFGHGFWKYFTPAPILFIDFMLCESISDENILY